MSDKSDVHAALIAAGAPDYMVLIITKIMGAEDGIREMMAALNTQAVELKQREELNRREELKRREELNQREILIQNHELVFNEREKAFVDAARDMMAFANRLYGPDSELTKINQKLGDIEAAIITREKRYTDRFSAIEDRVASIEDRVASIEDRVASLERKVH